MGLMKKIFLVTQFLLFSILFATTHYVDADTSSANWYNETNFSFDLNTALSSAVSGDTIFVAKGTYKPSGSDSTATFTLVAGVKMYGGFIGGETSITQRTPKLNETILSGDIGTADITSDNCVHVITASTAMTSTTVFDGFIIEDGNARGLTGNGGGIVLSSTASPLISNCIFRNNAAVNGAAGDLSNDSTSPTFEYCLFENNSATTQGGVFQMATATLTLTISHSTFASNSATTYPVLYAPNKTTVNIDSCVFWGNGTAGIGVHSRATLTISNSSSDDSGMSTYGSTTYTTSDSDGPFQETDYYYLDGATTNVDSSYGGIGFPPIVNIALFLEGGIW